MVLRSRLMCSNLRSDYPRDDEREHSEMRVWIERCTLRWYAVRIRLRMAINVHGLTRQVRIWSPVRRANFAMKHGAQKQAKAAAREERIVSLVRWPLGRLTSRARFERAKQRLVPFLGIRIEVRRVVTSRLRRYRI